MLMTINDCVRLDYPVQKARRVLLDQGGFMLVKDFTAIYEQHRPKPWTLRYLKSPVMRVFNHYLSKVA